MKRFLPSWRALVISSFAIFSVGVMCGWTWWERQSPQSQHYMLGRAAYMTTKYDLAGEYFDKSYTDYNEALSHGDDPYSPPPSLELAELSQHFKALSLIKIGNAKNAIITFKEALKLTTDYALSQVHLPKDVMAKVIADRKNTQIDFEILLQQKKEEAQKQGKGKGQPGKPGDKQSEDPSQGNNAGKTDRNAL